MAHNANRKEKLKMEEGNKKKNELDHIKNTKMSIFNVTKMRKNPDQIIADVDTIKICHQMKISGASKDHYYDGMYGELTANCYPDAHISALKFFNLFHYLLWTMDDQIDSTDGELHKDVTKRSSTFSQMIDMIDEGLWDVSQDEHGDVYQHVTLLRYIGKKFYDLSVPNARQCFDAWREYTRRYLETATKKDSQMSLHGNSRDIVSRYLEFRLRNSACDTIWPFVLLTATYHEPKVDIKRWLKDPDILRLQQLANWIISFTNDVVSYPKEKMSEGKDHRKNLLCIYIASEKIINPSHSLQKRTKTCIKRIKSELKVMWEEFNLIQKRRSFPLWVKKYIEGIVRWMQASELWTKKTNRYQI